MINKPKIFIGTMYHYENDYAECKKMIDLQKNVDITHYVVSAKNEYDAHIDLYSVWESVRTDHDAFIKIDADMILHDDTSIARLYNELKNSKTECIMCPIFDFFIDDFIKGIVSYASTNKKFQIIPDSNIYCDLLEIHKNMKVIDTSSKIIPIGYHCRQPNTMQSFYWGFHRGTKNRDVLKHLLKSISKNPHPMKEIALYGYNMGQKHKNVQLTDELAEELLKARIEVVKL